MFRLLLVDDEPNILSALRRCLHTHADDDDAPEMLIECFTSPERAIERCEEEDFDLILTDYRMPRMNGVQFLLRTIESNPSAIRMLMSAYADLNALLDAINEARVMRFICKPWRENEVRSAVFAALLRRTQFRPGAHHALDASKAIQRRLASESPTITELDICFDGGIRIDR
jgi:DNA-binding NtrC family response regulator